MADPGPVEAEELADEMTEERKAAEGGARKLNATVASIPAVTRNQAGEVTRAIFDAKVAFKGDVILRLNGEVASAYWSITPGMKIVVMAIENVDGGYDVERLDIVPPNG